MKMKREDGLRRKGQEVKNYSRGYKNRATDGNFSVTAPNKK